jgi:hypothetical protein
LEWELRMTLAIGRLFILALLGLAMTACGQDMSPRPRFVSVDGGGGPLTASPSPKEAGVIVAAAGRDNSPQNSEGGSNKDKGDAYFIEFRSRYALSYGHSYVVFGRANKAGEMIDPEVAGLHPTSYNGSVYMLGHVLPVPAETGASDGDLEEPYRSASWRVMVSEPKYQKVVAYIRKLQANSPLWDAAVYNCNAFAADVARFMGYKTPPILLRPQQFMTKLREMNTSPG